MVTLNKYIKALLHPAGDHQGGHKANQADKLVIFDKHITHISC